MNDISENIHPGKLLREQILNKHDLTVVHSASLLGITTVQLSYVLNGKSGLSPEMCHRIAIVFNEDAKKWAELQSRYELENTAEKIKSLNLKSFKP